MTSYHYTNERGDREYIVKSIGYGNIIDKFEVDKGHRNGPEIHEISDTGIITIYNKRTRKMITRLIARPGQIYRYYAQTGRKAPKDVMKLAEQHAKLGYFNRQEGENNNEEHLRLCYYY